MICITVWRLPTAPRVILRHKKFQYKAVSPTKNKHLFPIRREFPENYVFANIVNCQRKRNLLKA